MMLIRVIHKRLHQEDWSWYWWMIVSLMINAYHSESWSRTLHTTHGSTRCPGTHHLSCRWAKDKAISSSMVSSWCSKSLATWTIARLRWWEVNRTVAPKELVGFDGPWIQSPTWHCSRYYSGSKGTLFLNWEGFSQITLGQIEHCCFLGWLCLMNFHHLLALDLVRA